MQPMYPDEAPDAPLTLTSQVLLELSRRGGERLELSSLTPGRSVFTFKRGLARFDLLLVAAPADPEPFVEEMRRLMKAPKPRAVDIVIVGGSPELLERVANARPRLLPKAVGLVQVTDGGEVLQRRSLFAAKLLDGPEPLATALAARAYGPDDLQAFEERARPDLERARRRSADLSRFVVALRRRRPLATYAVAVTIGLVFALQSYVGLDATPALVRLGALVRDRVLAGELWRLASCTLLHGSFMHVFFNVYVLIILGSFFERLLGPFRLLLLLVASGLAGSVGSALLLSEGFSVGASGAIWGLLGAHAVLAFRKATLLPEAMLPGARRAAMINLGLNLMVSFMPHVDKWAHFAGGAVGALLLVSGLLTRGLTKKSLVQTDDDGALLPIPTPSWQRGAALAGAALMLGATLFGWTRTDPLALTGSPSFATRELPALGYRLDLPQGLHGERSEDGEWVLGDLLSDPVLIGLRSFPLVPDQRPVDEARKEVLLADLQAQLAAPVEGATPVASPHRIASTSIDAVEARLVFPSGLAVDRLVRVLPDRLLRVEVYRWPDLPSAPDDLAQRMAESAEPL